jgi:hypothetical protein
MITESQLRSLKRGAAIGMAAAIIAIVAVGIAGYSLVSARNIGADAAVAAKQPLEATTPAATPDPAAAASATPAAPTTAPAVQPAAPSTAQAAAAAQPAKPAPAVAQTPKPVKATHKASATSHRISRIEEKPVTIPAAAPDPTPAVSRSPVPAPAIAPQPVAAEPAKPKPAAHDSSAAH